jgi:exodeoxyribonuclease VII large subunit
MEPRGIGALQLAFEQLEKRLAAEGLFDEARKRPIPRLPERVGLVTSRTGSVVHDMVVRLRGRFHVRILPVKVQGEGAAEEIAEAIRLANAQRLVDVLVVGRGGGSLEDLWAFNEERVARAIFASRIPVVSAVGHEDDWTISDKVADARASTPTHAAQMLAQNQQELVDETQELIERLIEGTRRHLEDASTELAGLSKQLSLLHPIRQLDDYARRISQCQLRLVESARHLLECEDRRLQGLAGRLSALSPLAVLARGYSITFALPSRNVVTDARSVRVGDELETLLAHGRLTSTVRRTAVNGRGESNGRDA